MLLSSFRRSRGLRRGRVRVAVLVLVLLFTLDGFWVVFSGPPQHHVRDDAAKLASRVFIASIHWNNEAILRSHWNAAVLDLVRHLGPDNVYVAVLESGSWDDSKGALSELDGALEGLGAERSVELDNTTHKEEMGREADQAGWVWTSRGRKELRRIPYLSRLRNRIMLKLQGLAERENKPRTFDKVLWLNDVVFTTDDVLTLFSTNSGSYAAACSLDFSKPSLYYDTFALRDSSGAEPITQTWPYFQSSASRDALMRHAPVPVRSCWNGMVAFDAAPFYANSSADSPPLAFRGIPDSLAESHLEGSECCLIHADNALSAEKGVWLNPAVRVGYNAPAYEAVNPGPGIPWPSASERVMGMWRNRWARAVRAPRRVSERLVVRSRIRAWEKEGKEGEGWREEDREEPGEWCLVNEMQVLAENGWAHV